MNDFVVCTVQFKGCHALSVVLIFIKIFLCVCVHFVMYELIYGY